MVMEDVEKQDTRKRSTLISVPGMFASTSKKQPKKFEDKYIQQGCPIIHFFLRNRCFLSVNIGLLNIKEKKGHLLNIRTLFGQLPARFIRRIFLKNVGGKK